MPSGLADPSYGVRLIFKMPGHGVPTPDQVLERRLKAEAERRREDIEDTRTKILELGLDAAQEQRKRRDEAARLEVDILLVTATITEHRELRGAAVAAGFPFDSRKGRLGGYYHLGTIGTNRVAAMQVEMGAFGPNGSAARCLQARAETRATTIILLGTAFGMNPREQQVGNVLVSESVFLYEDRHVVDLSDLRIDRRVAASVAPVLKDGSGWMLGPYRWLESHAKPDYRVTFPATARRPASPGWVQRFRHLADTSSTDRILVGTFLSGGARIESARYMDELLAAIPALEAPIVGGEMEAAGIVAASRSAAYDDPGWIVVKGISDFADGVTRADIEQNRGPAAAAAARVVLRALQSATPETM